MTDTHTTQPAVDETKATAQPVAEVDSARNDGDELDKLLAEFDDSKPKAPPESAKPEPKAGEADTTKKPDTDPAVAEVQRYIFRQDMEKTVKNIRGDLPADYFDDDFVESWIEKQARNDSRILQAWANRHQNPKQFEKIVGALGRDFSKKYGKLPDKQATEDREAVTAAVRGASTKAPEGQAPDVSKMTPNEFQAYKDKLFGT